MHIIHCRVRIDPDCYHGHLTVFQFGEDLPLSHDSTYRECTNDDLPIPGGTIICDACYCALIPLTPSGRGLSHELDAAIELAKAKVAGG